MDNGIGVETLLQDGVNPEVFMGLSLRHQKLILQDQFGEASPLVDLILQTVSQHEPHTIGVKIESYLLAPSKISQSDLIPVADHIFTQSFASVNEIKEFVIRNHSQVASGPQATPHATQPDLQHHTPPQNPYIAIVAQMAETYEWTHNVTVEEAPGYLPLGNLLVFIGKMLTSKFGGIYKCHPQRNVAKNSNPGQTPSTDVAMILRERTGASSDYISKILYEYKPALPPTIQLIEMKHLLELFIQCYYVMKFEKTTKIIGCITNLVTWHFFKVQLSTVSRLEIMQYTKLMTELPPKDTNVSDHLEILIDYLT